MARCIQISKTSGNYTPIQILRLSFNPKTCTQLKPLIYVGKDVKVLCFNRHFNKIAWENL